MRRHRLIEGPFSALEPRLFAAIEERQQSDPLARVEVLVPSNLLGLDLRRRHAERLSSGLGPRGHANVRLPTFFDLAAQIAGDVPGQPAPPSLLFAAVVSAIARLPEAARFGEIRHRIGFARAVETTLRDLRDAGIAPDAFGSWVQAEVGGDRRASLEALGRVYADVASRLESFADEAATFAAAARRAAGAGSDESLFVYGFYDLTGLQRDLLAALAGSRPLQVFLPAYPGDLGDFGRPLRDFFSELLGAAPEPAAIERDDSARARFLERFALRQDGEPIADDGTLALVSACDDAGEAREAAREVLMARDEGVALPRTAILVRQESDAARFDAELGRAGIPRFRRPGETWAETPAGRALGLWLRLEEEGFRRDDVLDVLELAALDRPDPHGPHFRGLARQAGLVRGRKAWDAAMARFAALEPAPPKGEEDRSRLATRLPGGVEAAHRLSERWTALRESASGWPEGPLRFGDWAAEAERRVMRLYAPDAPPEPAQAALDALGSLADAAGEVTREVAFEVFLSGLASRSAAPGRLGRDGVAILTVMEARGLAFEHVLLPGLVEKSFPARARPDPLLFDAERESLALRTGRPLGTRTRQRPAEERLLFAIAADASRRRLTLLASRRDSALDRERTPSQFFTRAVEAAGRVRQTRLGRPTDLGPPVSLAEARRRALEAHGAEALASVFPPLEAALARSAARAEPVFGPYEGRLASSDLAAALEAHVPGHLRPVSPSALETFCKCPYQYFLRRVVSLAPVEDADEEADLGPLALGSLFHDAARRAALARRGMPFAEVGDDRAVSRLAASSAAAALEAFERESGAAISPALLREIASDRLRRHLEAWLRFERRGPRGAFAPAGAEVRFGPAVRAEDAADPELSSNEPALSPAGSRLRGQIDLIAVNAAEGVTRVTDFKVKMSRKTVDPIVKQRKDDRLIWSGEMLQLPVYALAAAGPIGERGKLPPTISSEYLFLAKDRKVEGTGVSVESAALDADETQLAVERLDMVLQVIGETVRAGAFRPRPVGTLRKDHCALCDFQAVCGPGHAALYANKADDPDEAIRRLALMAAMP